MIKSILQAIPTYVMSIFLLPNTLIDEIEKMLNSFWWGHSGNNACGLHWLSWERLSVSKNHGGMGFKDLQSFNLAMLGKQAWNLVTKPSNLITKLLKAKYFLRCENINVWNQNWLKDGMAIPTPTDMQILGDVTNVQDLMSSNSKTWDYEKIHSIFDSNTANRILQTPLFASVRADTLVWKMENDGIYSVRSAYKNRFISTGLQHQHGIIGGWNLIRRAKISPKVKNLLWRIGRNILPTRMKLNSRGVQCPVNCAMCSEENEDSNHVLFRCPKSIQSWQQAGLWMHMSAGFNDSKENLLSILERLCKNQQELFSVMMWSIWKCRNNQVWNNISDSAQTVYERANHLITSWRNAQEFRALVDMPQ
ncbi:ribonuclease H protein [Trifolium medium]|uniref:Ribonuclease H protein n=1 Tax=Trifolium medium TaxID=97028 RepID=A0A392M283_9FABA|nr:ribonuclease H protein [Trifolium medium]